MDGEYFCSVLRIFHLFLGILAFSRVFVSMLSHFPRVGLHFIAFCRGCSGGAAHSQAMLGPTSRLPIPAQPTYALLSLRSFSVFVDLFAPFQDANFLPAATRSHGFVCGADGAYSLWGFGGYDAYLSTFCVCFFLVCSFLCLIFFVCV